MRSAHLIAALAGAALVSASAVLAQSVAKTTDVVVMRTKLAVAKPTPTPTPAPAAAIVNGGFDAAGGGWTAGPGFTMITYQGATVGRLDSPDINTPARVTQSFAVVAGRSYTFSYKTYLMDGSYCAVPFRAYFADGATILAQDSFTHCGSYDRSFTWTADRTKTITIGFVSLAQSSNRTYPAVDDAKIVSN